jgi:PIN domain nuclease of toxin-antitoxin system
VIAGVADTHAALWYLFRDSRLSSRARDFIDEAAGLGHGIALSPISLAEMLYLVEKGRIQRDAYDELKKALVDQDYVLEEAPLNAGVVDAMRRVPRGEIPEMPDRIIAATSVFLGVPVISRDRQIRSSAIITIW